MTRTVVVTKTFEVTIDDNKVEEMCGSYQKEANSVRGVGIEELFKKIAIHNSYGTLRKILGVGIVGVDYRISELCIDGEINYLDMMEELDDRG